MTPFDYLKAINETKEDVMLTEQDEKIYSSFIVKSNNIFTENNNDINPNICLEILL